MSQYNESGVKTFTATSAITQFSRVKLTSSSGSAVELAGAGESFIGITTADATAAGAPVSVILTSAGRTYKAVAAEALAAGAVIYGGAVGKVQDTASGTAIGVAIEAATADGDVIEILLNNGVSGNIDGSGTAIGTMTTNGGVPVLFAKEGITDASTAVTIATIPYKFRIANWWVVSRDTTAANVSIYNVGDAASAVVAKGTADAAIVAGSTIIAAKRDIAAGAALKVLGSTAAAFDVYVLGYRVA